MKSCTPLWREAHFQVNEHTIGPCSDHFWKLWFLKSACRFGTKHIWNSKCTKHFSVGASLEVEMSKKCMPLWREAHFEVKMLKTPGVRTTFRVSDVEKVHAVVARSTFEVKMLKTPGVRTTFGGSDVASRGRRKGLCTLSKVSKTWGFCSTFNYKHHYTTLHSNTLHITLQLQLHLHYILLHYTPLHYTTLHSITLNYTTLHYIALHYTPLHYITLPYITLHYITLHYTTFHYTTLHYTTLHYTTLHYTEWHCTTDRQVDR